MKSFDKEEDRGSLGTCYEFHAWFISLTALAIFFYDCRLIGRCVIFFGCSLNFFSLFVIVHFLKTKVEYKDLDSSFVGSRHYMALTYTWF